MPNTQHPYPYPPPYPPNRLYAANGSVYTGDWIDGKMSGQGEFRYPQGDCYKGSFSDNQWDGEGAYTWANGDKFEGSYVIGESCLS